MKEKRKERMTVEELKQLLKENPNGVKLVCDTGAFKPHMSKVTVLAINSQALLYLDNDEDDGFDDVSGKAGERHIDLSFDH